VSQPIIAAAPLKTPPFFALDSVRILAALFLVGATAFGAWQE
jgi:hypothetical protein